MDVFAVSLATETMPGSVLVRLKRGDKIYCQQDSAETIYRLQEGVVGFSVISSEGKEALLALLGPGSYFGYRRLAGLRSRTGTAVAMTACTVQRVPKDAFLRHLAEDRSAMESFITGILERNLEYEADLCGHLFDTSEKRLMRLLVKLCRLGVQRGDAVEIPVKLTHEMMAQMVGTTRSRVTFFMNKFRRQGIVEYGQCLLVRVGQIPDLPYVHSELR